MGRSKHLNIFEHIRRSNLVSSLYVQGSVFYPGEYGIRTPLIYLPQDWKNTIRGQNDKKKESVCQQSPTQQDIDLKNLSIGNLLSLANLISRPMQVVFTSLFLYSINYGCDKLPSYLGTTLKLAVSAWSIVSTISFIVKKQKQHLTNLQPLEGLLSTIVGEPEMPCFTTPLSNIINVLYPETLTTWQKRITEARENADLSRIII